MYAHLNNSVYPVLIDSIICAYLLHHCQLDPYSVSGTDATDASKPTQIGLVVSSFADYFAPVRFPDVLDLGMRVTAIGRTSATYEVGVFLKGEDAVKLVGGYTHVFVERDTMRPRRGPENGIDPRIRAGLEKILVRNAPASKL